MHNLIIGIAKLVCRVAAACKWRWLRHKLIVLPAALVHAAAVVGLVDFTRLDSGK